MLTCVKTGCKAKKTVLKSSHPLLNAYIMKYVYLDYITYESHYCKRTVVMLFSPLMEVNKDVHTFFKGISLKVNVIARLEFELAYYKVAVQHFSYNNRGKSPLFSLEFSFLLLWSLYFDGYHHRLFLYVLWIW